MDFKLIRLIQKSSSFAHSTIKQKPPLHHAISSPMTEMSRALGNQAMQPAYHGPVIQPKLTISQPGDPYEREADQIADQIMRMPDQESFSTSPSLTTIQRTCAVCGNGMKPCSQCSQKEETLQRKSLVSHMTSLIQRHSRNHEDVFPNVQTSMNAIRGDGQPLPNAARAFFEPRFRESFQAVRIHTDTMAAHSAKSINARAFTMGNDIVFGSGQFAPETDNGKRLLAHELTHVVQQNSMNQNFISRSCSDPNFCKAYDTQEEIDNAEWWIRNTYLRLEGIETFGTEVKSLYESFLSRSPGDSLTPHVFNDRSSYVVSSFKESWDTKDDMDDVIDLVGARLDRSPEPLLPGRRILVSLSNFLSEDEMNNRLINYSNPFSVAGHIAGGIGSSDAGPDYRKIAFANVGLEKISLIGNTGFVKVQLYPKYEVFDAIDFCPGDCGSPAEQLVTIPMSRLEASGAAYDVPFKVVFWPESRSKRFWF